MGYLVRCDSASLPDIGVQPLISIKKIAVALLQVEMALFPLVFLSKKP
jgi:hypothetical protein